jgi:outer membrane lipoprotein-sorting protein
VSFIRKTSTSRLIAASTALVAVGAASVALAAGTLSASTANPPAKPLAQALADAVAAPAVQGVTARITFTNKLIDTSMVPGGSPLVAGGSGRLWAAGDGRFRLEIQSPSGDAQIVGDGTSVTVIQPGNSTVYKFTLPAHKADAAAAPKKDTPPTAADIQKLLDNVAGKALLSGATPTTVAGQPAYEVRVGPADNGGLIGAVAVAWDAARGVPLRVGVYARGATQPTLELAATDISFGSISSSDLSVGVPTGAKVQTVDLAQLSSNHGTGAANGAPDTPETPAQVQAKLAFPLHAPASVAGLPLTTLRSVGGDRDASALLVYGHGLGSIVVLEQKADPAAAKSPGGLELPTVSIGGASGTELSTALGSIVRVSKGGVAYTVIGSVPAAAAEAAAQDAVA